jgi:predicted small lipoprotein YifL
MNARLGSDFGYSDAAVLELFVSARLPHLRARRGAIFALALLSAALASGCGRKGALEPPPSGGAVQPAAPADPLHPQIRKPVPPITPPKGPFILDPLL